MTFEANDIPVPADYARTGSIQPAVYRPSTEQFLEKNSAGTNTVIATSPALSTATVVPVDAPLSYCIYSQRQTRPADAHPDADSDTHPDANSHYTDGGVRNGKLHNSPWHHLRQQPTALVRWDHRSRRDGRPDPGRLKCHRRSKDRRSCGDKRSGRLQLPASRRHQERQLYNGGTGAQSEWVILLSSAYRCVQGRTRAHIKPASKSPAKPKSTKPVKAVTSKRKVVKVQPRAVQAGQTVTTSDSNGHLIDQAAHTLVEERLFKKKGH